MSDPWGNPALVDISVGQFWLGATDDEPLSNPTPGRFAEVAGSVLVVRTGCMMGPVEVEVVTTSTGSALDTLQWDEEANVQMSVGRPVFLWAPASEISGPVQPVYVPRASEIVQVRILARGRSSAEDIATRPTEHYRIEISSAVESGPSHEWSGGASRHEDVVPPCGDASSGSRVYRGAPCSVLLASSFDEAVGDVFATTNRLLEGHAAACASDLLGRASGVFSLTEEIDVADLVGTLEDLSTPALHMWWPENLVHSRARVIAERIRREFPAVAVVVAKAPHTLEELNDAIDGWGVRWIPGVANVATRVDGRGIAVGVELADQVSGVRETLKAMNLPVDAWVSLRPLFG